MDLGLEDGESLLEVSTERAAIRHVHADGQLHRSPPLVTLESSVAEVTE